LTTAQAQVAAQWAANWTELSPREFDLVNGHHAVLKAAMR
jgi:hypothetical protein